MGRFDIMRGGALLRQARLDAGLTQAELLERAGLRQPSLAQMESGSRKMSDQMLERVLRAADYRPSLPLAEHADAINAAAARRGFAASCPWDALNQERGTARRCPADRR